MGRSTRYRATAAVKRVAQTSDGYGGLTTSETTVVTAYKFAYWNVAEWDREALVERYGLETDAALRLGTGDYNSTLQNNDILDISSSDRWQVLATNEVWGRNNVTPVSLNLVLARAGPRP